MKKDLDALMQAHSLDALLVSGPARHNPAMVYLTGGAHLSSAELIKKRGAPPLLFYNSMERDEAASTGLETRNLGDYHLPALIKEQNGSWIKALAVRYQRMLADVELTSGRIAVYGQLDAGIAYAVFSELQKLMPELTLVGELDDSVLLQAMLTKDENEVARIRHMGQVTVDVVAEVADFLTSQRVRNGTLLRLDGEPLTIADVKRRINLWLAERGAESPQGTTFAIGRDAAVPHSAGRPEDVLKLGQTIVFDIYPCEAGGGYYYDFTRTWCLGYATDEAQALYQDVLAVYNQVMSDLRVDTLCKQYQQLACEMFAARGHPTIQSEPQTQEGYVHGLGHGVGFYIHERPSFAVTSSEADRLLSGAVVTIEPGLYYPQRGLGVRLEDTVWVRPDGQFETLAAFPLDLVLPVN
jgi:Xaa-Pro aminopeptidase